MAARWGLARRRWLQWAAALGLLRLPVARAQVPAPASAPAPEQPAGPVLPGDAAWPTDADWAGLGRELGPALRPLASPWADCRARPDGERCAALFRRPANPYALGDDPALTQTFGWVGAWWSAPSPWVVAARHSADVVAAVNFARRHRLRLVVKGGGHSYQGTSNAAGSLLVWTRAMHAIQLHDAFVPAGCAAQVAPTRAVSVGAGALWAQAYDAVTTQAGGYVQGGGCMTVGVAGLVQSGGFGSFSKAFGTAAGNLLEAEVVTADGVLRTVNACQDPELFFALRGGGGGSFGIVTRLTLRVHPLPADFGAVNFTVRASTDSAYRRLVGLVLDFCSRSLVGPHWGEQLRFLPGNVLRVAMVFQGLSRGEAVAVWQPFFDALDAAPQDFSLDFAPLKIVSTSARSFWSPTWPKRLLGFIRRDERPGAPGTNVFWPGDQAQAGWVIHAYQSTWLGADLLQDGQRDALADALVAAARHHGLGLHLNKGLAGAPPAVRAAAAQTATHPAMLDAFALVICASDGAPAHAEVPGQAPDTAAASRGAARVRAAMDALRQGVPTAGAYLSESDYFQRDWPQAFWGPHHARLLAAKRRYDPEGLFTVHHGVGSEEGAAPRA
ncbi:MAG TPA: FAD-binding protein [Aquabacterium sp.]|nr:FAD-binding protein [Aquabacterium sp.]